MKTIIINIIILFNLLLFTTFQQLPKPKHYSDVKPSSIDVDNYIKTNGNELLIEYENYIRDSIFVNVEITTEDLTKRNDYDETESGRTEIYANNSYVVIINNQTEFADYSVNTLTTKGKKKYYNEYDKFVDAVVFHELTHVYIQQEMFLLKSMNKLNTFYNIIQIYPNAEMKFGEEFIQEGICEYLVNSKNDLMVNNKKEVINNDIYIPTTKKELLINTNIYLVKYLYASNFLKEFLDLTTKQYGKIKYGIDILLENNPPTYEEILNPNLFFNRLK